MSSCAGVDVASGTAVGTSRSPTLLSRAIPIWGIYNQTDTVIDASRVWWGSASGPRHILNPAGNGDKVSDNVQYRDWLLERFQNVSGAVWGVRIVTNENVPTAHTLRLQCA